MAEVLITLAIIGVVAALTIPTIVMNYEKKVNATRVKQAYAIITQAINLSEIDNGDAEDWNDLFPNVGTENTDLYMKTLFLPYMKAELCGEGTSSDVRNKCGAVVSENGQSYNLANGISAAFVPASSTNINNPHLNVMIDVNGRGEPNQLGNDQFYFKWTPEKGFSAYGAESECSREDILTGSCIYDGNTIACKKSKPDDVNILYRHGCTALLMLDNWEFKDDYPW